MACNLLYPMDTNDEFFDGSVIASIRSSSAFHAVFDWIFLAFYCAQKKSPPFLKYVQLWSY